jgi:hypothetical protein
MMMGTATTLQRLRARQRERLRQLFERPAMWTASAGAAAVLAQVTIGDLCVINGAPAEPVGSLRGRFEERDVRLSEVVGELRESRA